MGLIFKIHKEIQQVQKIKDNQARKSHKIFLNLFMIIEALNPLEAKKKNIKLPKLIKNLHKDVQEVTFIGFNSNTIKN